MDSTNGMETPQDMLLDLEITSFFDSAPPLKDGLDIGRKITEFIDRHSPKSGKLSSSVGFIYLSLLFHFHDLLERGFVEYDS